MKKLLIAFLAAILASGAFAQQSFPDIPEGHWAGDAVDRIADMNIVIGFPDGTFRGNEAFTRYQAALVVSRLLDVISENMDAALAMTNEDIASLRNAVQELSSDVAAQGTRLSAAEGAIAGLSDDVTGQSARLDELEAALGDSDVDPAVLRDLQNQIASQRVAIDTAQATADQALARANAAGSQADANAQEIAALNDLIQILGDQIEALQGAGDDGVDAGLEARVARNEGDIANIREFVILLRRDQVALRDRVSALEASDEQQTADIADLQDRVTAIEENPLGLSGSITLEYFSGRFAGAGDTFDVDRAYGVDFGTTYGGEFTDYDAASMGPSTFTSGTDDDATTDDDAVDDPGEFAADLDDIEYGSGFDHSVDLEMDWANEFGGSGPSGLNSFDVVLGITIEETDVALFDTDDDDVADLEGYVFRIDSAEVNFDFIGGASLQFAFGQELDVEFTPYTLSVEDTGGLVATIDPGEFLAFLDPELQIAYLTGDVEDDTDFWATGVRLAVSPLEGTTIGVNYVSNAVGSDVEIGEADFSDTIFGVDVAAALGPIDLQAEYANATGDEADFDDSILFVNADAEFDILGGIGFQANYRDIADGWSDAVASGVDLTDPDGYEFAEDQTGFGVEAEFGVFIVDLGAYFDSYSTEDPAADVSAFGVDAEAELFAGFSLTAFYESVSVALGADDLDVVDSTGAVDVTRANDLGDDLDGSYRTGFGVGLEHDGAAENALVPNLDLEFAYEQLGAGFNETHILAQAGYDLNVSIVSLSPYVGFESYDDEDADSDDTSTVFVGTGLETEALDIFLAPSLEAAVNYRATSHADVGDDDTGAAIPDYDATRLQWSVGLNLNEFLFENSTLSARYGSYTGTNVAWDDLTAGDMYTGDESSSVSGYELVWNYFDLEVSYGGYTNDPALGEATYAQAFGISYTVVLE